MSLQTVTDPIILDSTGQAILGALEDIKEAVQPANVYYEFPVSLPTTGWSGSSPNFTYTWSNSHVTEESSVEVFFGDGSEDVPYTYVDYEKVVGGVQFTATVVPSAAIPVLIKVINAKADAIVEDLDASMIETEAISGVSNVEQALSNLDGRASSASEAIANKIIFGSVTTISGNGTIAAITKDANNANLPNLTNYKTLTFELSVGDINNPPADITVTRANGSYTLTIANYGGTSFTVQPIFGCN